MTKLTNKEIKLLNGMRANEYGDAYQEGCTWTFTAVDNSGMSERIARGVISSLIKKGLITVDGRYGTNGGDDESQIGFTAKGKELFNNADGEECEWGGPRLLKEESEIEVPEVLDIPVEFTAPPTITYSKEVHERRTEKGIEKTETFKGNNWEFQRVLLNKNYSKGYFKIGGEIIKTNLSKRNVESELKARLNITVKL